MIRFKNTKIRQKLASLGITQKMMLAQAELVGVGQSSVYRWLSNREVPVLYLYFLLSWQILSTAQKEAVVNMVEELSKEEVA